MDLLREVIEGAYSGLSRPPVSLVPKFYLGTHLLAKFHFATMVEGRNTQDGKK